MGIEGINMENINNYKEDLDNIVRRCIEELIQKFNHSIRTTIDLRPEIAMQGYLYCLLAYKLNERFDSDLVQREYKTKLFYHRKSGIHDGFKYKSETYKQLRNKNKRPQRGKIDLAILDPNRTILEDEIPKALIGIEIEYPGGKWKKIENFKSHIIKDSKKLKNKGNQIDFKYLLCFVDSRGLQFDFRTLLDEVKDDICGTKFAYVEFNKKLLLSPRKWLKLQHP